MDMKPYNDEMKATPGVQWHSRITISTGAWYEFGLLHTVHGYVSMYRQDGPNTDDRAMCNVDFIWKGRWYRRRWDTCFTPKGMVRVGHRFVKDVTTGNFKKG